MLSKQDKEGLRSTIFRHLDGIVTATTAYTLYNKGVLDYLLEHKTASLSTLTKHFKANEGYLNVALRVLCSQGWLVQNIDHTNNSIIYHTNANSAKAFALVPLYKECVHLLQYSVHFTENHIGPDAFSALENREFISFI